MKLVIPMAVMLVVWFFFFQVLDWFFMDFQGLDYFFLFR